MIWSGTNSGRGVAKIGGTGPAVAGTILVHAFAGIMLLGFSGRPPQAQVIVLEVNLVAAPKPRPQQRRAPEVVQRPAEQVVPVNRPRRTSVADETPLPPTRAEEAEPAVRATSPSRQVA